MDPAPLPAQDPCCWVLPPLPVTLAAALEAWLGEGDSASRTVRRAAVADWLMRDRGL